MPKKILSYILAFATALLIIAPPLDYHIPLLVNSFFWCYLVIVSGFLGMLLLSTKLPASLKCLAVYLFVICFFSQSPYFSFNAYLLIVPAFYSFLFFKECDFKIITNALAAAFWLEAILAILQLMGRDELMNFDRPEHVFFGTVMQYMRFSSVLAAMAPFLIVKNKWYLIPILILCVLSKSSTFAVSIIAGVFVFSFLKVDDWRFRLLACASAAGCVLLYFLYDWGSWDAAIKPEHGGRLVSWAAALKTWVFDTAQSKPYPLSGPFRLDWFLFGHGTDTFLPLFPIYKHDLNPFPQAHNDWLQIAWECGIIGFSLVSAYAVSLFKKLYSLKEFEMIGGLVCIGTNMFFAFPMRITQTMLLIIAWLAYCERKIRGLESI